ncbi:MAG TPA: ABC transporter permease [Bacteroidia bacterium]|nr:ABC transporter permease [Bacteroidia bacterium]
MSKIGLIIKREYTTRVRKKSFLVMTILGPLLFSALIFAPIILANTKSEKHKVVVVDGSQLFCGDNSFKNSKNIQYDFSYCGADSIAVKNTYKDSEHVSVLIIPSNIIRGNEAFLHSKVDPGDDVTSDIENQMGSAITRSKLHTQNLPDNLIEQVQTTIKVSNSVNNEHSNTDINMVLGYVASFLIYMFIFIYSVQVMRGVMEEKVSRIVEVIISSVKPFQLMMGKVIGVGLIGFTQFIIWIVMSFTVFTIGSNYLQGQLATPNGSNSSIEQTMKKGMPQQQAVQMMTHVNATQSKAANKLNEIDDDLRSINWPLVVGMFIFYFLGGYLLYSSLFAAIGSAVDQETDTQQFMLPVTAPLILSIVIMQNIIRDPHSSLAFWFSIIPFTSPIAMMARIPFGINPWELFLSMGLLIASIFGTIWLAGRIYRVGLLMYGKKVTYKELGKWLFYK